MQDGEERDPKKLEMERKKKRKVKEDGGREEIV